MEYDITLVLTNNCNLNCVYCYEKYKNMNRMSLETLQTVLEDIVNKYDRFTLELFGGEPFLEFDNMVYIVDALSKTDKKWKISIITNGTLIHGKIIEWLENHKEQVECVLSIDGKRDVHNKNRSDSYDDIDIDFFVRTYKKPTAKMTVSEYVIDDMADNLIHLHRLGFRINATLAYGMKWSEKMLSKLEDQLDKYFMYVKYDKISADYSSLVYFPYKEIFHSKGRYLRNCDAGISKIVYNVDGKIYPCHMLLPSSLNISKQEVDKIVFPDKEVDKEQIDIRCIGCPIFSVCQSCYAHNYIQYGDIYAQDIGICKANRIIYKKKAEHAAKLWHEGQIRMDDKNEYMFLDSIKQVINMGKTT